MSRPNPKDLELSEESIAKLNSLIELEIAKARKAAILTKDQNPTWTQLMKYIDWEFSDFSSGIRGLWNVYSDEWVIMMSDTSYIHKLLCDFMEKYVGVMEVDRSSLLPVPLDWVSFWITEWDGDLETHVVPEYTLKGDKRYTTLPDKTREAIKYKISEKIYPELRKCLNDEFPYQDKPRLLSSITIEQPMLDQLAMLYQSGHYDGPVQGHFSELVYILKGKSKHESVLEFEKWLESQEN